MRRLRLGELVVDISALDTDDVADFLDRISEPNSPETGTHRLTVRRDGRASLVVDDRHRTVTLTLPAGTSGPTIHIGVLQALARGLAYVERSAGNLTLLHGSALTVRGGVAVAVLDGGLGQGKTSLAMGMARRHGRLLVDEFAFAHARSSGVVLSPAPTLPWHVRADMAPYLAPSPTAAPLLYPDELRDITGTTEHDAPLRLILVPDRGTAAGCAEPVRPHQIPSLLRHAVTDHLEKLADPRLDHVSIFAGADQVTDPIGRPLTGWDVPAADRDTVLHMLAAIPTYRIGIGVPADLPTSVAAAGSLVEAMMV